MQKKINECIRSEPSHWRVWFWAACQLFVMYSMLRSLHNGMPSDAFVCLLFGIGVTVPYIIEVCGYRVSDAVFAFGLLYMMASMSGRIYKLYYLIKHWDKMLHFCGGVVFALIGSYIPILINEKYRDDRVLRILFAILLSISVSALWEFYEFASDRLLGTDMQRDTIVNSIISYDLGDATGVIGSIDNIESVVVNGQPLEGYIDIGLIDTMGDMMIETVGAVIYAVAYALDKDRHPAFTRITADCHDEKQTVHA